MDVKDGEPTKPLQLEDLLINFKAHYIQFDPDFTPFKKLKEHKDLLLNPLSHDNIDSPIYKQELVDIKETLKKLMLLEYKQLVSIDYAPETFIYLTETASDGEIWRYKIRLKENLRAFKKLDGTWVLNNPECTFVKRRKESDKSVEDLNHDEKLNQGYKRIRHKLALAADPNHNLIGKLSLKGDGDVYNAITV